MSGNGNGTAVADALQQLAIADAGQPASLPVGVHDIPAARYHSDPTEQPSLSASIAHLLCSRSPRHAWEAHPRLNPNAERVDEAKFDIGTAAHALLLNGDDICQVVDAADWRTTAAKEEAEVARAAGLIPLLARQWIGVQAMVESVRAQLITLDVDPPLICDGLPEQTLVWEENGVTCRARLDWLRNDRRAVNDLKTTAASAHPRDWARARMWDIGADVQAAFYLRGVKALTGADAQFIWVVVENTPPYALSVISLAPSALELAQEKCSWAIEAWRDCLSGGAWPGYPTQVAHVEAPSWQLERWAAERWAEEEAA